MGVGRVRYVACIVRDGLYGPQTEEGKIFVAGVVATAYTEVCYGLLKHPVY